MPDWPVQPPPSAVQVTVSPAAGADVGEPPLASVLPAGKFQPPPPLQQVESPDAEMTQSTRVSSVLPVTMKSKLPGEFQSGSCTGAEVWMPHEDECVSAPVVFWPCIDAKPEADTKRATSAV